MSDIDRIADAQRRVVPRFSDVLSNCPHTYCPTKDACFTSMQCREPTKTSTGNDTTVALLTQRSKTHGDFDDNSRISQALKHVIAVENIARQTRGQLPLPSHTREAIDMILHKISRAVAGDADFRDHWDDIAGYAKLVSERCSK